MFFNFNFQKILFLFRLSWQTRANCGRIGKLGHARTDKEYIGKAKPGQGKCGQPWAVTNIENRAGKNRPGQTMADRQTGRLR
jgi:hypothetical protein